MSSLTGTTRTEYSPAALEKELTRLFGHAHFHGRQEEVVSQVLSGVDTIAIMPTGAGKSLCYQLPSMLLPGVTLVISPLIALMKDQYDSLPAEVYKRTTFINSSLEMDELSQRMEEIIAGTYKLVYCAPERLRQQPFVEALRRARISLLVVDEAHCVSTWGHDFRPDYLFIGPTLPRLGDPTLLALTATATPRMREEIATQLGRELAPVVASIFRPNLYYEAEELADKEEKMRRLKEICQSEPGSGVIYARSRETCEQMAAMLRRWGIQAAHYHAGLAPEERTRAQEAFMLDRVRIVVATIAFGMGIDKSNVRFIVHFSPPDSLEGYVQESGRAGRDGRPARCILFIAPGDKSNLTRWKRQEQLKLEDLRAIYREIVRQVPTGKTGYINMAEVEREASASTGKAVDSTQIRVGMSLLERAGLLVRHPDAPRTGMLALTQQGSEVKDLDLLRFREVCSLSVGQTLKHDLGTLSAALGTTAPAIERTLLEWQSMGWIRFRGDRRDPVVERLRPPADTAGVINALLEQQDRAQQHQIVQMLEYASADRCRHRMLAGHLGEQIEECHTSCDYCAPRETRATEAKRELPDLPRNPGQAIVECLGSFPYSIGKPSLVKALTGSTASNVSSQRVQHFGALAAAAPSAIERAIDELVEGGYLEFYEVKDGQKQYRMLRVTEEGLDGVPASAVTLKAKKAKERGARDSSRTQGRAAGPAQSPYSSLAQPVDEDWSPTPEEADLFERLRGWRRVVANRLNLPPFVIFHDRTLRAIARTRPQTPEELLSIKGVGRNNVEKYGADLLDLIAQTE